MYHCLSSMPTKLKDGKQIRVQRYWSAMALEKWISAARGIWFSLALIPPPKSCQHYSFFQLNFSWELVLGTASDFKKCLKRETLLKK